MRDKSNIQQVERWAEFCKNNPSEFRKYLNAFLNAQIIKAREFYTRLNNSEDGRVILNKLKAEKLKK